MRRFAILSFLVIVATTATLGFFLSSYLTRQMPFQDAVEATESLNALVRAEGAERGFHEDSQGADTPEMAVILRYLQHLPDVYLATIYRADGSMIWSTDGTLNSAGVQENDQLAGALSGTLNPEIRPLPQADRHGLSAIPPSATSFVTFAIPIWSSDDTSIVGAVEIRKVPETLLGSIGRVTHLAWASEAVAGAVLFCGLLLVVIYTTRVLQRHEARLIERERLAVVGEMASSVAHGLRNPLAAIRSCAELVLDDDLPASARGPVSDIVEQSERLESWIRSFLTRALEDPVGGVGNTDVDQVIGKCLENFLSQMRDRGIVAEFAYRGRSPCVVAQSSEVEQVLNSILSNSIEAMQAGGKIKISRDIQSDGQVCILIEDNGPGIPGEMVRRLFSPFESGKSTGLGIGLVLARGIVERLGGSLELRNRKRRGVEVMCTIPTCDTLS
ncbi:hypothetical protein HBA54_13810 [Pelagibius litoralis]|uniref:histidine kinase n=1 Tax=Pelagibius litoralis TaxID=374515 RepID=A0A967K774_9PROT|nr:ATP-binding protein [Pelagibius litoralis]NIA69673.1 hypothetical protein [Pelagibius litoralis]